MTVQRSDKVLARLADSVAVLALHFRH